MPYIVGRVDGMELCRFHSIDEIDAAIQEIKGMPHDWVMVIDPYAAMDGNTQLQVAITQKDGLLDPASTIIKLVWHDKYHGDNILVLQGTLNPDENDYSSILSVAYATEEFKLFELYVGDTFEMLIADSEAFNALNTLGRNVIKHDWPIDTDKQGLSGQDLYEAIVEFEERPSYLGMFFDGDVATYQTLLRVSDTLNCPLKIELNPTLMPDQMAQIATDLNADSHRVEIIANAVVARPNAAENLRGKKMPRYALGTLLGYTLRRNAATNAQGMPPLQSPVAGYNYPMRWLGMEMRNDVKFGEEVRVKLAKAKVNIVLLERYDTGPRFVLTDCLTQYNSKTSVLRLTNAAEISMAIDNRLIQICKRHLLKGKTTFKADALRECQAYLESCATAEWLVDSGELGGKYVIDITDREDRPHDAVNLHAGYRPEGAVRAVYLTTSVHK